MKIKKLIFIIFTNALIGLGQANTTLPIEVEVTNADGWSSHLAVSYNVTQTTGNLGSVFWLSSNSFNVANHNTIGKNSYAFYFQKPETPLLNGSFLLTYTAVSDINPFQTITGTYTIQVTDNQLQVIDNWDQLDTHHLCEFESGIDNDLKYPGPMIHISCLNVPQP